MADVFLSYSHRDQAFALQLVGALTLREYTTWFDKNDVFPAGEFREDIKAGIEEAGAFIFVLSPDSLISEECGKELKYAQACGKRLIPLLYRGIDPSHAPQALRDLDWIEDASFDRLLEKLLDALLIDKDDWNHAGQWLRLGHQWEKDHKQNSDLLLHGKELKKAEDWLKRAEYWRLEGRNKGPQPQPSHLKFIRESRRTAKRAFLVSVVVIFLLIGSTGGGAFLLLRPPDPTRVSNLADNDNPGSLRYAVHQAPQNSTITFNTSLHGTILLTSNDLIIGKNLTIRGPGADILSISGGKSGYIVHVLQGVAVTIFGLTFKDSKTGSGFIYNEGRTLTLSSSTVSGNSGGGIENEGTLTLNNSTVSGNTASLSALFSGGGIHNAGTLTLNNSTVSGNTTRVSGGGIDNRIALTLNSGTISYQVPTLTLNNSTVSGNTGLQGGGIDNYEGMLTLNNSTGEGRIVGDSIGGGGILNINGIFILNNSTVSDNTAADDGGGIYSQSGGYNQSGTLTLNNSTVSGNTANGNGDADINGGGAGGGIFIQSKIYPNESNFFTAQVYLIFSTIYSNTAHNGADITIEDLDSASISSGRWRPTKQRSQVKISNSIVADEPAHLGSDIVGRLTSRAYNLFQSNSGAAFDPAASAQYGTDKMLSVNDLTKLFAAPVRLRNNGGLTKTLALAPDSSVVDQIPLAACHITITVPIKNSLGILIAQHTIIVTTDQRGMKRPDKGEDKCDIGAYEYVDMST